MSEQYWLTPEFRIGGEKELSIKTNPLARGPWATLAILISNPQRIIHQYVMPIEFCLLSEDYDQEDVEYILDQAEDGNCLIFIEVSRKADSGKMITDYRSNPIKCTQRCTQSHFLKYFIREFVDNSK